MDKHGKIRSALVERVPVLDEATFNRRRGDSLPVALSTSSQGTLPKIPNAVPKPAPPLVDLLDLSSDDLPPPGSSGGDFLHDLLGVDVSTQPQGTSHTRKSGTGALLDLLSIEIPDHSSNSSTLDILSSSQYNSKTVGSSSMMDLLDGFGTNPSVPVAEETNSPTYPEIVAFESSSLKVIFNFSKEPGSRLATLIEAQFTNKSADLYSDFVFQAAVPKYLQLHLNPASGNTLSASSSITQKLRVINNHAKTCTEPTMGQIFSKIPAHASKNNLQCKGQRCFGGRTN